VLLAHIPEFGSARNPCDVTAQILANPESLGACADALLGDPAYGALVVPQTYGYAPSARRVGVYDSLAAKHGRIACIAWQSEWLEGPGVKEAEEAEHVALFRSMPSCFASLAAWHWRAAKRAAHTAANAPTPADTVRRATPRGRRPSLHPQARRAPQRGRRCRYGPQNSARSLS
jgi:acetyl-CoA synthetase